jgi:hypothetical protein
LPGTSGNYSPLWADASPAIDVGPFAEQRGLDVNLVKAGEVTGLVRSFHVNNGYESSVGVRYFEVKDILGFILRKKAISDVSSCS